MTITVICISLAIFGLIFGSFAGASVWRLRARSVAETNSDKTEIFKLKKLTKQNLLNDRSVCLNCSYELRWYDMLPVFSWLFLRGKCRKCHKPIGWMELLIELGMAIFFVFSFLFWPHILDSWFEFAKLGLWLIAGVGLGILFVYDFKWGLLPTLVNRFVIAVGLINSIIVIAVSLNKLESFVSVLGACLIMSGVYWVIYKLSNGRLIGGGDIPLGLGLALLLADWKLAYVALMAANLIGCMIILPIMVHQKFFLKKHNKTKKLNLSSRIPFAPLFIIGFVISGLFGQYLIDLYMSVLL